MSLEFLLLLLLIVKYRENPDLFTRAKKPFDDDYQNDIAEAIVCDAVKSDTNLRLVQ